MLIGIMGAMPEETEKIFELIQNCTVIEKGSRKYYRGELNGFQVVAVFSRWGKVAAATTATHLILEFKVDFILFTGVAGAIDSKLNIGDIVIGERLYQHDMDARPFMPRFEIPLTGKTYFKSAKSDVEKAKAEIDRLYHQDSPIMQELKHVGLNPKVYTGDIASGDLFINGEKMRMAIARNLEGVLCCEMEGAAVAQVCADYQVSMLVVRAISDTADENSHTAAIDFVDNHFGNYSIALIQQLIPLFAQ